MQNVSDMYEVDMQRGCSVTNECGWGWQDVVVWEWPCGGWCTMVSRSMWAAMWVVRSTRSEYQWVSEQCQPLVSRVSESSQVPNSCDQRHDLTIIVRSLNWRRFDVCLSKCKSYHMNYLGLNLNLQRTLMCQTQSRCPNQVKYFKRNGRTT